MTKKLVDDIIVRNFFRKKIGNIKYRVLLHSLIKIFLVLNKYFNNQSLFKLEKKQKLNAIEEILKNMHNFKKDEIEKLIVFFDTANTLFVCCEKVNARKESVNKLWTLLSDLRAYSDDLNKLSIQREILTNELVSQFQKQIDESTNPIIDFNYFLSKKILTGNFGLMSIKKFHDDTSDLVSFITAIQEEFNENFGLLNSKYILK